MRNYTAERPVLSSWQRAHEYTTAEPANILVPTGFYTLVSANFSKALVLDANYKIRLDYNATFYGKSTGDTWRNPLFVNFKDAGNVGSYGAAGFYHAPGGSGKLSMASGRAYAQFDVTAGTYTFSVKHVTNNANNCYLYMATWSIDIARI
jgi:hypothetical protein